MSVPAPGEPRASVAARVARARELQAERFAELGEPSCAPTPRPTASCSTRSPRPTPPGRELLLRATERMHLTARGYHRVLRVARTIADLDGTPRSPAPTSPRPCPSAASPRSADSRTRGCRSWRRLVGILRKLKENEPWMTGCRPGAPEVNGGPIDLLACRGDQHPVRRHLRRRRVPTGAERHAGRLD